MAVQEPSASLLAHFGSELRRYRTLAGLTQEQVGEKVGYTNGLISAVENARRMPSRELVASLDEMLGTDGALGRLWPLVREHAAGAPTFRAYLDREASATVIYTYESFLVPGLLQTEDYARHVVEALRPSLGADEVQARVAARMSRQDVLAREQPPQLWIVLGEAVLNCQVGSTGVMRDQLKRLADQSTEPNFTLQVLPFSAGPGAALGQSFLVAEFAEGPPAFHVDSLSADLSDEATLEAVGLYKLRFDHLRVLGLPEDQSRAVITRRVEELNGHD